jgi:hypothetical protein
LLLATRTSARRLEYLRALLLQILESFGVPQSAVQLDYSDAPSGISIIIRSSP